MRIRDDFGKEHLARKVGKFLYLVKNNDWKGRWYVICPVCHRKINSLDYFESDNNCIDELRGWAKEEVHYHMKNKKEAS